MLTPHRRDGLIEWMKHMLQHSFVLDCLAQTAPTTFQHFEELIDEHRMLEGDDTKSECFFKTHNVKTHQLQLYNMLQY